MDTTVLGSMSRHRGLVVCAVLASVLVALAYAVLRTDEYRAEATVSVPRPAGTAEGTDGQYLDSQVLLLSGPEVADRAVQLAGQSPEGADLGREDFSPGGERLVVTPPAADATGSFGTTVITVAFTATDPAEARAGVNAFVAAYEEVRTTQIVDRARARLRGIDRAISEAESKDDLPGLRAQRAQALIDQETDLANQPSIDLAEPPATPAQRGAVSLLGVGLGFGVLAGGAVAFARASRLQHVAGRDVAAGVYDAPLLGESARGNARQPQDLLARAVRRRLDATDRGTVVAVVASPEHPDRADVTAGLALALADDETLVLAVDAAGGAVAGDLLPGTPPEQRTGRLGQPPTQSPLHAHLDVLEVTGDHVVRTLARLRHAADVVVVGCPPMPGGARAVDLLGSCDTAVVLVREDEPVQHHVETARWLALTGTPVLGYVFTPTRRRRPRDWWRDRVRPGRHTQAREPSGTTEVRDARRIPLWSQ
jgi:hypothetical protein